MYSLCEPPKNWREYGKEWLVLAIPILNANLVRYHNMGTALRLTYTKMLQAYPEIQKLGPKPNCPQDDPELRKSKKPDVAIKLKLVTPTQPPLFSEEEMRYPSLPTGDPKAGSRVGLK